MCAVLCLVTQSCLTLQPHELWPTKLLYPWDFPGENTGVGCHVLFQGIFPTQIEPMSPALQAYSLLSEAPWQSKNTRVGSLSLLQRNFLTQESNWGLLHCRQVLYQLSYPGSPIISSVQFSSVAQLCPTLCDPRNCPSMSSMLCIPR